VRRGLLIGAGCLLIVLVVAFYFFRGGEKGEKYETVEVDRGDIVEKITATGTINPVITVRVGSQVSGRIAQIFADFNSQVEQGQIIAQLETDVYQTRVAQADANFQLAKAQEEESKVALLDAKNNLRRITDLSKGLVASERELEIAETTYKAAQAAHSAAQARTKQSRALLTSAQVDLEYTTIYSPVDGIVISRNCDVGQTVVASFQTPDLFLIAKDLTQMQVEAYVDEADIGKVQAGQEVLFTVDAFPERIFNGRVSQVRFAPREEQNVVTYATVIEVANPDLSLRPGMTATVSVITNEKRDALRVESIALRFKADPEDNSLIKNKIDHDKGAENLKGSSEPQQALWVFTEGGHVKPVLVRTGISDGNYTQVLDGSLREGDRVIVGYVPQWEKSNSSDRPGFGFRFRRR
jgi:HlyD family secretion protein